MECAAERGARLYFYEDDNAVARIKRDNVDLASAETDIPLVQSVPAVPEVQSGNLFSARTSLNTMIHASILQ